MKKVRRWAPGVDTEMFTPGENPGAPRPFTFITVASLAPVKGHRLLFRAFNNLRRKAADLPIRWLIVGDGPLRAELEAAAAVPRLRGYVDILGEVTHDRLPELYREAGAFLLGSLHEAQCMAVLEAMACGLPWVGPKVGALDDLLRIDTGETPSGLAFAARKHDLVADLMLRMAQEASDVRRSWGEQARRRVVREYEVERQTERLVNLLRELTG
jgi:colanic acid/amylovoran biosynthesis glycosyltransferase